MVTVIQCENYQRRQEHYPWYRVNETQYTVKDPVLYDSFSINVRIPNNEIDNKMTYKGIIYMPHHCITKIIFTDNIPSSKKLSNLVMLYLITLMHHVHITLKYI